MGGSPDAEALLMLESLRWPNGPCCPHCGSAGQQYFLTPANGLTRKTRTGADSARRVWKCAACRRQFSVWTGSSFARTRIRPLTVLCALFTLFDAGEDAVTVDHLADDLGVSRTTAFTMWYRIRHADADDPLVALFRPLECQVRHALEKLAAAGEIDVLYQARRAEPD